MIHPSKQTPRHPIRVVSRRTGLSVAVLPALEERHGAVEPSRTDGGQRLYSDQDVSRLSLLRRVVREGRRIGRVAGLSTEELGRMAREDEVERGEVAPRSPSAASSSAELLAEGRRAVASMDPRRLEGILKRGAVTLAVPAVIEEVAVPLLTDMGDSWRAGELGPAQEHVASVVIRRFLEWLLSTVREGGKGPVLVSATLSGERHELGALLAAVVASREGWQSFYVGSDLPAREVAEAASMFGASAVALIPSVGGLRETLKGLGSRVGSRIGAGIG